MELDMTKGSPFKLIVRFIIPVVLGNIFQQLYNMVDTIIVGRYVGIDALGAVGATGTISFLILGFAMGLTTGFTVLTAQKYGAGDMDGVKRSVTNAVFLAAIVAVVLTVLSVALMPWLLRTMNTPSDIFNMSYDYISTICKGLGLTIMYNICASLLRAVGNSKTPLYFLVIAAVLNVILDLVFIINFGMGVKGAALATVISTGISGFLCLVYIIKKVKVLVPDKANLVIDRHCISSQLNIGLPMALQFSITATGTIIVQAALNLFGTVVVASYAAANKVGSLMTLAYGAMGVTMATYSAQNRGINDIQRIRKGVRIANIISMVYSLVMFALAMLTLPYLLKLFVDKDSLIPFETILGYARTYIFVSGLFYIPLGMIFIFRNSMQGCGFSFAAMTGGIVELICRGVIAFVATKKMSFLGVCLADPLTWGITGVFFIFMYFMTVTRMDKAKKEFHLKKAK